MSNQSNYAVYRKWLKAAHWMEIPVLWLVSIIGLVDAATGGHHHV